MGVLTQNPSYSIRAQTNAQRRHQLKLGFLLLVSFFVGVLIDLEDEKLQTLNHEEYNVCVRACVYLSLCLSLSPSVKINTVKKTHKYIHVGVPYVYLFIYVGIFYVYVFILKKNTYT
jgi:hypothetical protein